VSAQRILGIDLLLIGVFLFVFGMNASQSAAEHFSNTFPGRFAHDTVWYIFGGGATAFGGLLIAVSGVRNKGA
jgi:Protein of unknown function (DUF3185)